MTVDWTRAFSEVIADYRGWLRAIDDGGRRLKSWNEHLTAPDHHEAAVCEATTWDFLRRSGIKTESAEHQSEGGPDFCCRVREEHFYVESTCLKITTAANRSLISPEPGEGTWDFLTWGILNKCKQKAEQLSGLDAPVILAVCTLHRDAATACFDEDGAEQIITGDTSHLWTIDPVTERMTPVQQTTLLQNSCFLAPSAAFPFIEHKRKFVSGVLLHSPCMPSREIFGALHPCPNHPFDPKWLSDVRFCRLQAGYEKTGRLQIEWTGPVAAE